MNIFIKRLEDVLTKECFIGIYQNETISRKLQMLFNQKTKYVRDGFFERKVVKADFYKEELSRALCLNHFGHSRTVLVVNLKTGLTKILDGALSYQKSDWDFPIIYLDELFEDLDPLISVTVEAKFPNFFDRDKTPRYNFEELEKFLNNLVRNWINDIFAEKLKIFLQKNIPELLTNKTYQYKRNNLYTYPPLGVVFNVKNKDVFDIDDILEIIDVVGRSNTFGDDFFGRCKSPFNEHSTYLLIDYLTKNSKAKDVKHILNFLADNFHQFRLLGAHPIICEEKKFDLYKGAINKFKSFLEAEIQEYFKISNTDDLAIDFNNILLLKEEMFENLFDENFELKEELAFIIINKLSNDLALISFIEVFDKSKKNFDIVELQKKLEKQTLNVRIEDIDLDSIEDIIYHLKQNKFFKKLFFGKIHINFTFCGEPALPAITRDTVHLLKKLKKDFGITTNVPEFLFDYIK